MTAYTPTTTSADTSRADAFPLAAWLFQWAWARRLPRLRGVAPPEPADAAILQALADGYGYGETAALLGYTMSGMRDRLNALRDANHLATVEQVLARAAVLGWVTAP